MRRYVIHPRMTPKRLAYLRAVEADTPYEPRHGVVANHCITLGWVETVLRMQGGHLRAWKHVPFDDWGQGQIAGQRLTAAGREALRKADGA